MKTLRLILGDQLNLQHSWFDKVDEDVTYCMFEMRQETDYVNHHIQKIVAFFLAMRSFADELSEAGHNVVYYKLDASQNKQGLIENLTALIEKDGFENFEYQEPDEYRLDKQLKAFCADQKKLSTRVYSSEHFLSERMELEKFFEGKKTYLMESFYRSMRKRYDILMEGGKPLTGKWNYDHDNRKKLPKDHIPPAPFVFKKDVTDIYDLIKEQGVQSIGVLHEEDFVWPTTRQESLALLDFFCEHCLIRFGTFQDAMTPGYWSLYHSRVSFALNVKLISPLEVIKKVVAYWEEHEDEVSIAQTEGFVRQILGWREYMRGVYWAKMPEFAEMNFLDHQRDLPGYFWTGDTKMACMKHAIQQSLHYAYAHHIQRLMITGNFALLAGISPDQVDEWYLGIYIDAIQWVEITNTRGMSQFADGGIVGTKPYVSSANYIDKMSHYCKGCYYNKKEKVGERSCPFNSLYWHFYDRHKDKLQGNPRIGMAYRLWNKMDTGKKEDILGQAEMHLNNIEQL